MPWAIIDNRLDYYRPLWVKGRSHRHYIGKGPIAELAAAEDAPRRLQCEQERRPERAEQERLAAAAAPLLELCELSNRMMRASLVAAGYYQHVRSEWRRRGGRRTSTQQD